MRVCNDEGVAASLDWEAMVEGGMKEGGKHNSKKREKSPVRARLGKSHNLAKVKTRNDALSLCRGASTCVEDRTQPSAPFDLLNNGSKGITFRQWAAAILSAEL